MSDRSVRGVLAGLALLALPEIAFAAPARPFVVIDDIEAASFGDRNGGSVAPITISPDGALAVVVAQRGRMDLLRPEAELRVYRLEDLRESIIGDGRSKPLAPLWSFTRAPYREGPVIQDIRWFSDSRAFGFLLRNEHGRRQLTVARVDRETIEAVTPEDQDVAAFDIRDATNFIYAAVDERKAHELARKRRDQPAVIATDSDLPGLLFAPDRHPELARHLSPLLPLEVLVVRDGERKVARDGNGKPLLGYGRIPRLALAPNGKFAVSLALVSHVPGAWTGAFRDIRGAPVAFADGTRDSNGYAQYVVVDMDSGIAKSPTNAPAGLVGQWLGNARPAWSRDSDAVLLPNSYVSPDQLRPDACIAIADMASQATHCIAPLPDWVGRHELLLNASFVDRNQVSLVVFGREEQVRRTETWVQGAPGVWSSAPTPSRKVDSPLPIMLTIRESANERPVLWANDASSGKAGALWDPNPQLDGVELGSVRPYRWRTADGLETQAGLYLPPGYRPGQRYPLVVQTHGFQGGQFRPSGMWGTAFAAQALASAGIVVLQVPNCADRSTADEGPCNAKTYAAGIAALVMDGMVDSKKVGIVGFSITVYYALRLLVDHPAIIAAAVLEDGANGGYFTYMSLMNQGMADATFNLWNGGPPFGDGLKHWIERAPPFRSDRIRAPLQIRAHGEEGIIGMWEPFAALRYQRKPVEFVVLNSHEHILTNPAARLASQGGTVDWFRFWLQDYEDPDPAKAEQYARWRRMRQFTPAGSSRP